MTYGSDKKDIRLLSIEQLEDFLIEKKQKSFRAKQIDYWIWQKNIEHISQMSNLPFSLREILEDVFVINPSKLLLKKQSSDHTIKNIIKLFDEKTIEAVLIPTKNRSTACVSSQVGCGLDCSFCATSKIGLKRNLHIGEIYDQVHILNNQSKEYFQRPLSNLVFMGMGEPLLNHLNVVKAIDRIVQCKELNLSYKRITVSSSGLPKIIKKIADESPKFKLAISLHSAREEIRQKIMPFSKKIPLKELYESLSYWYEKTASKITFEYVVWKNINDKKQDIEALIKVCQKIPSKVNLIEYNSIGEEAFQGASQDVLNEYIEALERKNITVKIRHSRGGDIEAACGQLAGRIKL